MRPNHIPNLAILLPVLLLTGCNAKQGDAPASDRDTPGLATVPLSDRFTDHMVFPALEQSQDHEVRRRARQLFEMVLVPGDVERGIEPFYLSETEVRLEMFYPMAVGFGMGWTEAEVYERLGFRPSIYLGLYYNNPQLYHDHYPALAMSRTVAELYCKSLSELTGRNYRLPTEAEWNHAMRLGGGLPGERMQLLLKAQLQDNSFSDAVPFGPIPAKVRSKQPDALGLYDLLGNAAEWVTDTGEKRVVRGGHFDLPADQLSEGWRGIEDLEVWNETYPQDPKSTAIYHTFCFTGIRLACDADQAPAPESGRSEGRR